MLVICVLYLGSLAVMPPEGLTHHDTGAKYLQVRNLRLASSGLDYAINYPARPLDPTLQYVPFLEKQHYIDSKGHIYLQWPIFLGLLTRIPWKLIGFWGLYVVPLLAGLGACWATYLLAISLGVPRRVAWLSIPMLGLATPIAIYSLLFFEHTLAAMLVALSLLFLVSATPSQDQAVSTYPEPEQPPGHLAALLSGSKKKIAISGAIMSIAIYFRSDLYVMAAVMTLLLAVLAWRIPAWRKLFAAWFIAFVAALVPLWAFYAVTEGTLLPLHATWYFAGSEGATTPGEPVKFELPALRYIVHAGWGIVPDFLMGPEQSLPLSPVYPLWVGALGLIGTALCGISALLRLARGWAGSAGVHLGVLSVGLASVAVATGFVLLMPQPYHNLHGFLLAGPFIALALWPPRSIFTPSGPTRHGLLYLVTLLHVGLHAVIISALSGLGPFSRHEWGQRYLLTAYPGLVVLALLGAWRLFGMRNVELGMERTKDGDSNSGRNSAFPIPHSAFQRFCIAVVVLLVLIGVGFNLRGYQVLYDERTQVRSWLTLSETLPAHEPLVTDEWWLPLNLAADFYTRPIMLAVGDDTLSAWAADMRSRGVKQFGFMTDKPSVFSGSWVLRVPGLSADGAPQEVRGIWVQRYSLAEK